MKFDFSHVELSKGMGQIKDAITLLLSTPKFIIKHKLWKGFLDYKWVFVFSIVIAGLFSLTLFNDISRYLNPSPSIEKNIEINLPIEELDKVSEIAPAASQAGLQDTKESLSEVKENLETDHQPLFSGSLKFLLLIFLEVFIFHFSVKTNNILKGENKVLVFKDFVKAQKRMILVMGRKWVLGLLMYIMISILCALAGMDALRDTIMFFIYGFYLGFAFLDNYLEQYGFTIKNSVKCIQTNFGASALFGVLASILLNVPFIGPLAVPFIFGIAATRYGHARKIEAA